MERPQTTRQVADALGTTEARINDLIRRNFLPDPPPVLSGRRLWFPADVAKAREALSAWDARHEEASTKEDQP